MTVAEDIPEICVSEEQIFRRNFVKNQYDCFVYALWVILGENVAPCLQMTCKWPKKHFVVSHKKESPFEALKPSGNRLFRDTHNSIFFDKRNFFIDNRKFHIGKCL